MIVMGQIINPNAFCLIPKISFKLLETFLFSPPSQSFFTTTKIIHIPSKVFATTKFGINWSVCFRENCVTDKNITDIFYEPRLSQRWDFPMIWIQERCHPLPANTESVSLTAHPLGQHLQLEGRLCHIHNFRFSEWVMANKIKCAYWQNWFIEMTMKWNNKTALHLSFQSLTLSLPLNY